MLHILLVEDSDADFIQIHEGFKRSGIAADVQLAQNSEQALRLLTDSIQSDFIVLDSQLPELDAVRVLKHCRSLDGAADGAAPAIMMSGSGNDCERRRVLKLGARDSFAQPASFAAFFNMFNDVVARWNVTIVSSAAKRRQHSCRERAAATL